MELICKCGGKVKETNHQVTTEKGIDQWSPGCNLPATVEQSECKSCGRYRVRIFDASGEVVMVRG